MRAIGCVLIDLVLLVAVICLFKGERGRRKEIAEDLNNLKTTSVSCHSKIKDLEDRLNKNVLEEYAAED